MTDRLFDNRYEIRSTLGSGAAATVYLAHDQVLDRDVALKILLPAYKADPQFVERFHREANSAAGLNHPNIVQVYDRGEAEGSLYIAMEYVPGPSLKQLIRERGALPPSEVVSIARHILGALAFLHRRRLIHRDVKPQNVLVGDGWVKLTDFGIARAVDLPSITDAGQLLGTAHYLSPEQAQGRPVTPASDLYSLGVVMYEMATGRLPFDDDNAIAVSLKHLQQVPPPPHELVPGFPPDLEAVILRALAKSSSERYPSAEAFLSDLDQLRVEPASQPVPWVAPGALAVGASAQRSNDATQVRRRPGSPPRLIPWLRGEPQGVPPPRRQIATWVLVVILLLLLGGAGYAAASLFSGEGGEVGTSSSVPATVTVPSVLGMTEEEATAELQALGLMAEVERQFIAGAAAGTVGSQAPAAGQEVSTGSAVTIIVAGAPTTVSTQGNGTTSTTKNNPGKGNKDGKPGKGNNQ